MQYFSFLYTFNNLATAYFVYILPWQFSISYTSWPRPLWQAFFCNSQADCQVLRFGSLFCTTTYPHTGSGSTLSQVGHSHIAAPFSTTHSADFAAHSVLFLHGPEIKIVYWFRITTNYCRWKFNIWFLRVKFIIKSLRVQIFHKILTGTN